MIKSTHKLLVRFFCLTREERMCLVYTVKNSPRLLRSFLLTALSIKVTLQSPIHPSNQPSGSLKS